VIRYALSHLPDPVLLRALHAVVATERDATALVLAHLAEADARRLYAPAGYPSMFAYCVGQLGLSEDVAFKRIRAARVARRYPAVFLMVADGRLHLSALVLLAPHLTDDNAAELFAAATHQGKAAIEQMLAERFPQADLPESIAALGARAGPVSGQIGAEQVAPGPVSFAVAQQDHMPFGPTAPTPALESAPRALDQVAPGPVGAPRQPDAPVPAAVGARPGVAPLAPERYGVQFTVSRATHDKLRHAQALIGHAVADCDLAGLFDRALDLLIAQLEQRKFAATARPHRSRGTGTGPRRIPAAVRRAVWRRDEGRCTFETDQGQRCEARARLEFDHVEPVARGGRATEANLRLRCRAHNQHAADLVFGAGYMSRKRGGAKPTPGEEHVPAPPSPLPDDARRAADEALARVADATRAARLAHHACVPRPAG
jgi:hypothetical protein